MYNRYIPQPDGSYQRKSMQDSHSSPPPRHPEPRREDQKPSTPPSCPPEPPKEPPKTCDQKERIQKCPRESCGNSPFSFLRNLLPGDFDTGDLLIVLLLLLMAGDCEDGQSNALRTLALYIFM